MYLFHKVDKLYFKHFELWFSSQIIIIKIKLLNKKLREK